MPIIYEKKKNQNKSSIHTIETLSLLLFSCLVFFLLLLILFAILQMFCYFALTESRLLFPVMYLSLWNWLRRRIWELVHRIARWECQTVLQAHRNPRFLYLWKQPTKPEEYSRKKKKTKSEKFCRLLVFFLEHFHFCLFVSFSLFHFIFTHSHSEFKCGNAKIKDSIPYLALHGFCLFSAKNVWCAPAFPVLFWCFLLLVFC